MGGGICQMQMSLALELIQSGEIPGGLGAGLRMFRSEM